MLQRDARRDLDKLARFPLMPGVRQQLHWPRKPPHRFAKPTTLARNPVLPRHVAARAHSGAQGDGNGHSPRTHSNASAHGYTAPDARAHRDSDSSANADTAANPGRDCPHGARADSDVSLHLHSPCGRRLGPPRPVHFAAGI